MAIDYWTLTKDYKVGDFVQKFIPGRSALSPYCGRVTAVMRGIGFVDVQWPFGNERVSPEELIRVNPDFAFYLPPSLNFSYYPGYDTTKTAAKAPWRSTEVPVGFHKELAKLFHRNASEMQAYDELWHRFASFAEDEILRDEIGKFYRFASNSVDLFLAAHAEKTATYWYSNNRTHRATKAEVASRRPNCPKCGSAMRKTTYKMAEGEKARLFACPKDLYLIRQSDIHGPDGNPVAW